MLEGSRCFVVVPARNEGAHISRVLVTMPAFVDAIIVVSDGSTDDTAEHVRRASVHDTRISLIEHARAEGVGGAIVAGYRRALAEPGASTDALCVMAGDGQMAPEELAHVATPIARGEADYVKGNRFLDPNVRTKMPPLRYWGGRFFSKATALAIGEDIHDSQCGFTALARGACERLDLDGLWRSYGYPNDLLSQCALRHMRIAEVPVSAVYGSESSGLRPRHGAVIAALILRGLLRRRHHHS